VLQHRLVIERSIGRLLERSEVVHHRNGNRTDNRLSNLELIQSQAAHMSLEHSERRAARYARNPALVQAVLRAAADPSATMSSLTDVSPRTIRRICIDHNVQWQSGVHLDEQQVRIALQGRTTEQAASHLGVHTQTLRNRFDHLLEKRRSPGWYEPHRSEIQRIASTHSMAEAARRYGTHRAVIRKLLRRWSTPDATPDAPAPQ